jgi:hypothetical protein
VKLSVCDRRGMGTSAALLGWEIRHHHLLHGYVRVQRRTVPDTTQTLSAWGLRHVRADRFHPGTTDAIAGKENSGYMDRPEVMNYDNIVERPAHSKA